MIARPKKPPKPTNHQQKTTATYHNQTTQPTAEEEQTQIPQSFWLVSRSAHSHVPDDNAKKPRPSKPHACHLRIKLYPNQPTEIRL